MAWQQSSKSSLLAAKKEKSAIGASVRGPEENCGEHLRWHVDSQLYQTRRSVCR